MSTKQPNWPFVINLGNSIIGVSVLAMPFCFKQCGVLLGMFLLLISAWLTHTSCKLLLKGAFTSRKRSYEYLALHTFGSGGKLCVEISIIGLLIGTCVAFFVIIGDLGPAIVSKLFLIENSWHLRLAIMVFLAFTVALPLGLLRSIESLANVSAISIGFYSVFIAEVFTTAFPNLWSGIWVAKVVYWNPAGVFKCLPIFSLAFACQTQLFVMYDALHEASVKKMSTITKSAIGMVTLAYLLVGFFGYVAFCEEDISGDILLNFRSTIFSEAVKLGFVLSIAVSFPLVIFPLRAAIYTLLFYKQDHSKQLEVAGPTYIPDLHVKCITLCIILTTLTIGVMVPNIEFVLAMTGATMGSMISFIFPSVMFISVAPVAKNSGKSTAQLVLFLGFTILLASTYVTLNTQDQQQLPPPAIGKLPLDAPVIPALDPRDTGNQDKVHFPLDPEVKPPDNADSPLKELNTSNEKKNAADEKTETKGNKDGLDGDARRDEPPNPMEPDEADVIDGGVPANQGDGARDEQLMNPIEAEDKEKEEDKLAEKNKEKEEAAKENEEAKEAAKEQNAEAKHLIKELKEQQKVQENLIKEQREIIEELKQHKKESHDEVQKVVNDGAKQVQPEPVKNVQGDGPYVQTQDKKVLNNGPEADPSNQRADINEGMVVGENRNELKQNAPNDLEQVNNQPQQQMQRAKQQEVQPQQKQAQPQQQMQQQAQPQQKAQQPQHNPQQEVQQLQHNLQQPQHEAQLQQHNAQLQQQNAQLPQQDAQLPQKQQNVQEPLGNVPKDPSLQNQQPPNAPLQHNDIPLAAKTNNIPPRADLNEEYLRHMLVNLVRKPDIVAVSQVDGLFDADVSKMIQSLSKLNDAGDQWNVQLKQNIDQLLGNPALADALQNVAKNAGISENIPPVAAKTVEKISDHNDEKRINADPNNNEKFINADVNKFAKDIKADANKFERNLKAGADNFEQDMKADKPAKTYNAHRNKRNIDVDQNNSNEDRIVEEKLVQDPSDNHDKLHTNDKLKKIDRQAAQQAGEM